MQIVLLAAGLGSRLKDLTEQIPKALIEVKGKTLINYAIDFFKQLEIDELIIIGGYGFDKLEKHIKELNIEIPYRLIKNEDYKKGNILTLEKAFPYIEDSFFVFNVDHIYQYNLLDKMNLSLKKEAIIAFCDFDRNLTDDDMKVETDSKKIVKNMSKKLTVFDGGYIGITFIHKNLIDFYKNQLEISIKEYGEMTNIEKILDHISNTEVNNKVQIMDTSGIKYLEVDNKEDLENAINNMTNTFLNK